MNGFLGKRVCQIEQGGIRHLDYSTTLTCVIPDRMPNYRRAFVPGGCWFFAVDLWERRQTLLLDRTVSLRGGRDRARKPSVRDRCIRRAAREPVSAVRVARH